MAPLSLIPCSKSREKIPFDVSDSTVRNWLKRFPDLGVRGGGRYFWHAEALDAVCSGAPLSEAAAIGRACRAQRAA